MRLRFRAVFWLPVSNSRCTSAFFSPALIQSLSEVSDPFGNGFANLHRVLRALPATQDTRGGEDLSVGPPRPVSCPFRESCKTL